MEKLIQKALEKKKIDEQQAKRIQKNIDDVNFASPLGREQAIRDSIKWCAMGNRKLVEALREDKIKPKYDENKVHYVVITGIIVKSNKFLIVKRAYTEKAFPGKWTVPGGKLELSDYKNTSKITGPQWYNVLDKLLKREIKEETNLGVENMRYLTNLVFIRPDNIPTVVLSFFVDYLSGSVKLNEELIDYVWINLKEAKRYDLIEGIYEELEMVNKILNNSIA